MAKLRNFSIKLFVHGAALAGLLALPLSSCASPGNGAGHDNAGGGSEAEDAAQVPTLLRVAGGTLEHFPIILVHILS